MFSKEAALLDQIAKSREAIREKHLQLKHGLQDIQENVTKVFKPLVQPLNKIAHGQTLKTKNSPIQVSNKNNTTAYDKESFVENLKNVHHSTPWKRSERHRSSSLNEDEEEEDDTETMDFKTIRDSFSSSIDNLEDSSSLSNYLKLLDSADAKIDTKFGIHKKSNQLMIGSEPVVFEDGKIIIKNTMYPKTEGLIDLLFLKNPDEKIVEKSDIENFRKIALETNLLRKGYKKNSSFREATFNAKYLKYLKELNPAHLRNSQIKGRGLPSFMIAKTKDSPLDYKYWDDPNELVDRLRLLVAERSAGNNNHDNEILAIIEELREAQIIY